MRTCAKCHRVKPLSEFAFKNKSKGTFISYCKECNREYQRNHYASHKSDYHRKRKDWRFQFRKMIRGKILEYLDSHPCVDCGETDSMVLEFDHVRGKKRSNVATLIGSDVSWNVIVAEIEKCDVRCANCHKRKSAKQLGWYKYAN